MGKFAKLFELEDGNQVLYTMHYNSETDKDEIKIRTDVDGVEITLTINPIHKDLKDIDITHAIAMRGLLTEQILPNENN